jgi:hypothetical protein
MVDQVLMDGFIQAGFIQAEGQYPRLTALGSKVLLLVCYSGFRSVTRYGHDSTRHDFNQEGITVGT